MSNASLSYLKEEDILHLLISGGAEERSVELSPNIIAEINGKGRKKANENVKEGPDSSACHPHPHPHPHPPSY